MTIGVKYCGGCNPFYDRGFQMATLKKQFPEHTYRHLSEEKECDIWIVVCGCLRACAYTGDLAAKEKLFVIDTAEKFEEIKEYLTIRLLASCSSINNNSSN